MYRKTISSKSSLIVLAAGSGSRLNMQTPKSLAPIKGVPSLHRIIDAFVDFVDAIVIVVSPSNSNAISASISQLKLELPVTFYTQRRQTGILDAVKLVAEENRDANCWLIWGDQPLYTKTFVEKMKSKFARFGARVCMPIFRKYDGYVGYEFEGKSLCQICEQREGDQVSIPSWSDGGLFFFIDGALLECLEHEADLVPGAVTGEVNFLSLLPPFAQARPGSIYFHKCFSQHGQGFNTCEELSQVEQILDNIDET